MPDSLQTRPGQTRPGHIRPALIVCFSRRWTGLEALALLSAEILRRSGAECEIACARGSAVELEARGRGFACVTGASGRWLVSISGSWAIREWMKSRPDASLFCSRLSDAFVARPALIGFAEARLTVAALFAGHFERRRSAFARWVFHRVDSLIAHSSSQKSELLKCLPVPASRVAVLAPSSDLRRFRPDRKSDAVRLRWNLSEGELAIGAIGHSESTSADGGLLQALAIVARNKPRLKWKLIVLADPADPRARTETAGWAEEAVARLGKQRVELLAGDTRLPDFCANVDLFVSMEKPGAFDLRLLEAMASNAPTLAPASSASPEMSKDRASLFWRSGNPWDLARQLERAILDPQLRARVASEGRQLARTRHDAATFERGLIRLVFGQALPFQVFEEAQALPESKADVAPAFAEPMPTIATPRYVEPAPRQVSAHIQI